MTDSRTILEAQLKVADEKFKRLRRDIDCGLTDAIIKAATAPKKSTEQPNTASLAEVRARFRGPPKPQPPEPKQQSDATGQRGPVNDFIIVDEIEEAAKLMAEPGRFARELSEPPKICVRDSDVVVMAHEWLESAHGATSMDFSVQVDSTARPGVVDIFVTHADVLPIHLWRELQDHIQDRLPVGVRAKVKARRSTKVTLR